MAIRDDIVDRAGRRCERCGRYIRDGARASLHHRKLRSQGGTDTHAGLVLLCGSGTTGCHGWVHANPAQAQELGLIVPSWADVAEVPITTPRGTFYLGPHGYQPVADRPTAPPLTVHQLVEEMRHGSR